ncbi:hypothetical protein Drorol1_Dr00000294 [Drosera rotundifolia]
MISGKNKQVWVSGSKPSLQSSSSGFGFRGLNKDELGGIIFGCKNNTMQECLAKQLFGLRAPHFLYVQNIVPGLPLFLFNYCERNLYGIFEAASYGQMNIDPYGWTSDGPQKTSYPAQVQIRLRLECRPLSEKQFSPIIETNYYEYLRKLFWFELDHVQVRKLIAMFSSQVVSPGSPIMNTAKRCTQPLTSGKAVGGKPSVTSQNEANWNSDSLQDDHCLQDGGLKVREMNKEEIIFEKLEKLLLSNDQSGSSAVGNITIDVSPEMDMVNDVPTREIIEGGNIEGSSLTPSDFPSALIQEIEELKAFKKEHIIKMAHLEHQLVESEIDIHHLKNRCARLELMSINSEPKAESTMVLSREEMNLYMNDSIFLVGGYDGDSWLSSLVMYSPSRDVTLPRRPMTTARMHSSVASLFGNLFVVGGGDGCVWCDTVESYNVTTNEWTSHPSLKAKRGNLAAATSKNKIFAIGGGDGIECFSDVEMLDPNAGRWIASRSMLHKRFALASAVLSDVIYVAGGFDGKEYMGSAERFDPRDHSWCKIANMNTRRACHSLVVLHEKLYALGGFDGTSIVSSVEVYDPRSGTWMPDDPMNCPRGYSAAAVLNGSIYVSGGIKENNDVTNTVEQYEVGHGWQLTNRKGVGRRCYSSALVL